MGLPPAELALDETTDRLQFDVVSGQQADVRERVLRESERFRKALPELLKEFSGKWVVFLDGAVRGVFGSEDEAYVKAVEQFGLFGGFVVAPVVEQQPVPMTAALMFTR